MRRECQLFQTNHLIFYFKQIYWLRTLRITTAYSWNTVFLRIRTCKFWKKHWNARGNYLWIYGVHCEGFIVDLFSLKWIYGVHNFGQMFTPRWNVSFLEFMLSFVDTIHYKAVIPKVVDIGFPGVDINENWFWRSTRSKNRPLLISTSSYLKLSRYCISCVFSKNNYLFKYFYVICINNY